MIADWLESYATHQHIVHWLSSSIEGKPVYDPVQKRWDVIINRNGQVVRIRPAHIVLATGTHGVLGQQANVDGVRGEWRNLTDSVNTMSSRITDQVRSIAQATVCCSEHDAFLELMLISYLHTRLL